VLMVSYSMQYAIRNVSHCSNTSSVEYVKSGHFVELTTDGTNQTVFQWHSLEHVDVEESVICPEDPNPKIGNGTTLSRSFDYL
jgi:hypothetical protein